MKKQSGFTLIELMVVMAIIAILATAGLSAYTGYIRKARDTTRIADLGVINTIILADLAANGVAPDTSDDVYELVKAMNNGQPLRDPLGTFDDADLVWKSVCINPVDPDDTAYACGYSYWHCDDFGGYILSATFESKSNIGLYDQNASGANTTSVLGEYTVGMNGYDIGSCRQPDDAPVMAF